MNSFGEYLRPFLPYIPSDLISADCLDEILSVTQRLPPSLGIGPFMFECSLDGRPVSDFSAALLASRGDHAKLFKPGPTDTTSRLDDPDWGRIYKFVRSWADSSSSLSHAVDQVWLEFDVCLTRDAPSRTPSVFFSLGYQSPREPGLRRRLASEYVRVAREGLDVLGKGRPSPATLSRLADCFHLLPASAQILFLGAMTSRDSEAIRVVASGLNLEDMVRYAHRVGLQKPLGDLAPIVTISDLTDHMWLAMDVTKTGIAPRIGYDCYCHGVDQVETTERWADLLNLLVEMGICTDRKRSALLVAAGMSNRERGQLAWPESLRRVSTILGPTAFDRLGLDIHHIKVIDRPGVPLEAKAYLCANYR